MFFVIFGGANRDIPYAYIEANSHNEVGTRLDLERLESPLGWLSKWKHKKSGELLQACIPLGVSSPKELDKIISISTNREIPDQPSSATSVGTSARQSPPADTTISQDEQDQMNEAMIEVLDNLRS